MSKELPNIPFCWPCSLALSRCLEVREAAALVAIGAIDLEEFSVFADYFGMSHKRKVDFHFCQRQFKVDGEDTPRTCQCVHHERS